MGALCPDACTAADGWGVAVCAGDGCSFPFKFKLTECSFTGSVVSIANSCRPGSTVLMSAPTADSTTAPVHEPSAAASFLFDGKSGAFVPRGSVTFAGGFCVTPPCPIVFQHLKLTSVAPFSINGTSVSNLRVENSGEFSGSVAADGVITFSGVAPFDTSATVGGTFNSRRGGVSDLRGHLNRATGVLRLEGDLTAAAAVATFRFDAPFDDTAPVAFIDGPLAAECGLAVTLSAQRSFDPDGDALVSFEWFEQFADHRVALGSGVTLTRTYSRGDHLIGVFVKDARGRGNFAYLSPLRVSDTRPPSIEGLSTQFVCLWPPNHKLVPLVMGQDVTGAVRDDCDSAPSLVFLSTSSSQPVSGVGDGDTEPDAVVAPGGATVCLRAERSGATSSPRQYDVVVRATDASGNSSVGSVRISVQHDQRPSTRCSTLGLDRQVEESDPRCVAASIAADPPSDSESPPRGLLGCQAMPASLSWVAVQMLVLLRAMRPRRNASRE